jgi:hypothetical protein
MVQVIAQERKKRAKKRFYDHRVRQAFAGSDSESDSNVICGAQERRSGKMQSDEVGKRSRGIVSSSGRSEGSNRKMGMGMEERRKEHDIDLSFQILK